MIIFIDLDGTLTDTADVKFKKMKDGEIATELAMIPIIPGAQEFVVNQKKLGNTVIIVSDSHPKYVDCIARQVFDVKYVSLADKPNVSTVLSFVNRDSKLKEEFKSKDKFLMVGDSWLDIELGRRLNIRTVLTKFYKPVNIDIRDGIGQKCKLMKIGPSYCVKSYSELKSIIEEPIKNLLAIESVFQGESSSKAIDYKSMRSNGNLTLYRCLARQQDGECDRFARADKCYQIDNQDRSQNLLLNLSVGVENYLSQVFSNDAYEWDCFTYVSDKESTSPSNKMKEIFDYVDVNIEKDELLEWSESVDGSIRNRPNRRARSQFISENLHLKAGKEIKGQNIIILDDQLTTGATADEICKMLRAKGAKNILFITLFYLILPVESKNCPKCGKSLRIKIRKSDGNKFYSCIPPEYRGDGCGYTENIDNE